jgi:hypothetical protein
MSTAGAGWADKVAGWHDDVERIRDDLQGPDRPSPTTRKGRSVKASAVASMADRITGTVAVLLQGMTVFDDEPDMRRQASELIGCVGKNLQDNGLKRDPMVMQHALGMLQAVAAAMCAHKGLGTRRTADCMAQALRYQGALQQALASTPDPVLVPAGRPGSGATRARELATEHPDMPASKLARHPDAPDIEQRGFRRAVSTARKAIS